MAKGPPEVVTLLEAAAIVGETYTTTVAKWRVRGWRPIAKMGNSLLFRRSRVSTWLRVYKGGTRKAVELDSYMTFPEAARFLGLMVDTLKRRYRLWGVPFYRSQNPPYQICFTQEELSAWTTTPKGMKTLRRNVRS